MGKEGRNGMNKDDRFDADRNEKTGMGKEAKIGLALIGILLVVFGLVLANRLQKADDDTVASNSKETSKDTKNEKASAAKQTAAKDGVNAKTAGAKATGKTTVVPAKTVSKQTPRTSANQWSIPPSKSVPRATGAAKAPSYMPTPNTARYAPSGNPASQTAQQAQYGQSSVPKANPFRNRQASQTQQAGQTPNRLTVLQPPRQSAQPAVAGSHGGYATSGGYSPKTTYQPRQQPGQHVHARSQASQYSIPNTRTPSHYSPGGAAPRQAAHSLPSGTYTVRPNDNYWEISRKLYGTGSYFKALAEHNRNKVPQENELAVGDEISAPPLAELEKTYPELCPKASRREIVKRREAQAGGYRPVSYNGGRKYVVQEGDTLFDIARYELGKASRWVEIHGLNRDVLGDDFDYLTPGLELVMPSEQKADNVTQRPAPATGPYYRR